jgi:hypothetical protein
MADGTSKERRNVEVRAVTGDGWRAWDPIMFTLTGDNSAMNERQPRGC